MTDLLIRNATIINENEQFVGTVLIDKGKIAEVKEGNCKLISEKSLDATNLILIPGVIDEHVHFREPGLTHKADIWHESRAAAAGGVTSYMEMPNTNPQTVTQQALQDKFNSAAYKSLVNYSFYIGATNDNLDELLKADPKKVCGIKLFIGASTGNMLVDQPESLHGIFSHAHIPLVVHCEDEIIIKNNLEKYRKLYGNAIPIEYHPLIRNEEACYKSTSLAIELAEKYNTRLHVLHLSTGKELELFKKGGNLKTKKITSEVCIHHLWFHDGDYMKYGSRIKWNPAIKTERDRVALFGGLLDNCIDVIATDHAPHTMEEKMQDYIHSPSGGPLIQHSLVAMLEFYKKGEISLEKIVEKMCHAPAEIFHISKRGFIRKGYWADLVLIDLNSAWKVNNSNILSKCGWSPFKDIQFSSKIHTTLVNGAIVYTDKQIIEEKAAMSLEFER